MKENFFHNDTSSEENIPPKQEDQTFDSPAEISMENEISLEDKSSLEIENENPESEAGKENSAERTEIMENARSERLGLLNGVFARVKSSIENAQEKVGINKLREKIDSKIPKPAQELMSQMMDVSSMKMYAEAGTGKNLTGKELTPKDRILSALSGGTNDIAKCLFAYAASTGSAEYAKLGSVAYGASWLLLLAKNGPKMMQSLKDLAVHYGFSEATPVLIKAEEAFNNYGYQNIEESLEPAKN